MEVKEVPTYVFDRLASEPRTVPDVLGEARIGECHGDGGLTAWLRLSTAGPLTTLGLYAAETAASQATLERPALMCVEAGFGDNRISNLDRRLNPRALRIVGYQPGVAIGKEQAVRMEMGCIILRQALRAASQIPDITFIKSQAGTSGT